MPEKSDIAGRPAAGFDDGKKLQLPVFPHTELRDAVVAAVRCEEILSIGRDADGGRRIFTVKTRRQRADFLSQLIFAVLFLIEKDAACQFSQNIDAVRVIRTENKMTGSVSFRKMNERLLFGELTVLLVQRIAENGV